MDMRTVGKDFELYYRRAREDHGIVFTRTGVAEIVPPPCTGPAKETDQGVKVVYEAPDGFAEKEFDLVVLAAGMESLQEVHEIAGAAGIDLDRHGFCPSPSLITCETSRGGVFAAGAFQGPCDIPETVARASAAAAMVGTLLSPARPRESPEDEFPLEREVTMEEPRIAVFVCHCGTNIGRVVDVPSVVEYAASLHGVVHAGEDMYACSENAQHNMKEIIREKGINRVIVAACTPHTHEPLFRSTIREAGLNPFLFEMTNIRNQCSWVHRNYPVEATGKARIQVSMAVARAREMRAVETQYLFLAPIVLVLGGGIAGLTSALAVAANGFQVFLVEKTEKLGGIFRKVHSLENTSISPQGFLDHLIGQVETHPEIHVLKETELEGIEGHVGSFRSRLRNRKGESLPPVLPNLIDGVH